MALGDHPRRTVVYGAGLIVAAMVGATLTWQSALPGWLTAVLLVVALVMALAGWVMTFRDLSPPRNRRSRRPGGCP
jgi:hypothetical protein